MSLKRLNYFNHQFLEEQDFKAEQSYHIERRRLHNRLLHSWGVAEGLEVRRKGDREIVVDPGAAYDREGREIVLAAPATHDVSPFTEHPTLYVTLSYKEHSDKADFRSSGGVENYNRITEGAEISFTHEPLQDGSVIPLARVQLDDASRNIRHVQTDIPQRKRAGGLVSPVAGWLRLPFKPVRLESLRVGERLRPTQYKERDAEAEFVVDIASAYCGERGARGTMPVPPPPGASRIKAFRIAGETAGSVQMELFRTGWNLEAKKREQTLLVKETISEASFHKHLEVKEDLQYLNPESHTLALSVVAEGTTTIWLVAARFE
ncbi:MAG TPA: hypothetical protein VG206_17985 [Terriglobia bacterium]|nr:hypothetical protein [Terriglobia bacterium]